MQTLVCSHCDKEADVRQFGTWVSYFPSGYDHWPHYHINPMHCEADRDNVVAVTQAQMDLLSNPCNTTHCCDAPAIVR